MSKQPLRIAVVGAGPAGLYAIEHLLEQGRFAVEVDLFERLPTPWGLARSGVAPDHPEKKLVIDRHFAFLLQDQRVRFLGNVEVGTVIHHSELVSWYDAVLYASGATDDTRLGIVGENLPGCWSAREFVSFYNGHPDHRDLPVDLSVERAVVVGNGNVGLDVARILAMPIRELERTDVSDSALHALRRSRIREVVVLGRRGHEQAAFKNPELEELERLSGVDVVVDEQGLPSVDSIEKDISDHAIRRKLRTLHRLAERPLTSTNKRIVLRFLESPVQLLGNDRVEQVEVMHNRLERDSSGKVRPRATGDSYLVNAGLVLRAVGFRGRPLPGLQFDDVRGVVVNDCGRVLDSEGHVLPRVYVAGWAKRGCQGIIGSNKKCAAETVGHVLADAVAVRSPERFALSRDAVLAQVRKRTSVVLLEGWHAIDREERREGRRHGRPRVKIAERHHLLHTALIAGDAQ
ncbi:FAD-dependent oxidoreductase [Nocardia sp. NPDC059239]|uniref:FAD-dependent oxidoreductase n=1 Tax=unclassified Nocardia TaxID=2637762 RepID=UPI00369B8CB8